MPAPERPATPRNPYLNRVMIRRASDFYGRRREVAKIFARIGASRPQSVAIVGERRIGKSSLLNYLCHPEIRRHYLDDPEAYTFVLIDLQEQRDIGIPAFFGNMFRGIGEALGRARPPEVSADYEGARRALLRLQEEGRKIILLFDEFDAITRNPNFPEEFFAFLRAVANKYDVAYVTTSGRDLQQLCHAERVADSPFFNIFSNLFLTRFEPEEALALIREPSEAAGIPLGSYASDIIDLAGLFPFFLQVACSAFFEQLAEGSGLDLGRVGSSFLEEAEPHFKYIRDHFDEDQRRVLLDLAENRPVPPSRSYVLSKLKRDGYLLEQNGRERLFSSAFVESLLTHERTADRFKDAPPPEGAASVLAEDSIAPLSPGSQLGRYRIDAPLGRGGMGIVYRAYDSQLERYVAIKILPAASVADATARARLLREARAAAALNHPHICTVHEVGEAQGQAYIAMELVEGQPLSLRVLGGPLPAEELLRYALQLAEALAHAHERGVVHRDLKSANVVITPEGRAKVLDFGLAKRWSEGELTQAATQSQASLTLPGALMGTLAYMAPEHLRGHPADARSDVWALGVVLYEMAAGVRPFHGQTGFELSSAILNQPPPPLPAEVPPELESVIERCLAKEPARRYQRGGEVRAVLEAMQSGAAAPPRMKLPPRDVLSSGRASREPATQAPSATRVIRWLAAITTGMALIVGSAYVFLWPGRNMEPDRTPPLRMSFSQVTSQPGIEAFPSLSPDGRWVVYAGEGSGNRDIYLQSVTGQTPINLTADSPADDDQPVFSPDGERIAFRSSRDGGGIFVMGRTGESVRRVTRMGFRPTWSPDGTQLTFTTENVELTPQNQQGPSELWVVDVNSAEARRLEVQDAVLASWSPLGHRIAYTSRSRTSGTPSLLDLWTISFSGDDPVAVTSDIALDWNPVWSPDGKYLYFTSDRGGAMNLWRVAIDQASGRTLGEPEPVTTPGPFVAHPSISADGTRIAYSSVLQTRNIQRLTLDPSTGAAKGEPTWLTTGSRSWANPDPSPDGQWVTFYSSLQPEGDIYVMRTDGTGLRQVTSEPNIIDRVPRWSPDNEWIAYFSNRSGLLQVWKIRPDGSGLQQMTEVPDRGATYHVWSPDGTRMAVSTGLRTKDDPGDVYLFDPNRLWKEQTSEVLPRLQNPPTAFVLNSWSPDGKRLAGTAGVVGTSGAGGAQGIVTYSLRSRAFERLTDFGEWPAWFPDSRHLLFVSGGTDFYVLDTQSKEVRKVFSVTRDVIGPPQLSKDGRQAYFSRRMTEADIWLVTLEAGASAP